MYTDAAFSPWETDVAEENTKHASQYIHEQGIDAEWFEEQAPFLIVSYIDNPDE